MDFFSGLQHVNFLYVWSFLLFATVSFLSWKSNLKTVSYLWLLLFAVFAAASKIAEIFSFGNFLNGSTLNYISVFLEYISIVCFFVCARIILLKTLSLKYTKIFSYICIVIPLIVLPLAGFKAFQAASIIFLWIPSSIVIGKKVFNISKDIDLENTGIFAAFVFSVIYFVVFFCLKIIRLFDMPYIILELLLQIIAAIAVFVIANVLFKYFRTLHEKRIKIYDYIPSFWKKIPLGAIIFAVLALGLFISYKLEINTKNSLIKNNNDIVSSVSETISARFSKAEQLSNALGSSPFLKEALSYPSRANITVLNNMFKEYKDSFQVSSIFAVNNKGDIIFTSDYYRESELSKINVKDMSFFFETLEKETSKVFTKSFFESDKSFFASIIVQGVKLSTVGVLVVRDGMDDFENTLRQYENIYLADSYGNILLSSKKGLKVLWPFNEEKKSEAYISKEVFNGDSILINGELFYVTRQMINDERWSVIYFSSLSPLNRVKITSMLGVSAAVIILLLLFWVFNQSNNIYALALQHKAVLNSARFIAIVALDTKGDIVIWGQGAQDLTGYAREEISKASFEDFLFSKKHKPISFKEVVRKSRKRYNEWLFKRKNGEFKTFLVNVEPQFSINKKLVGYIISAVDISETKKIESELAQQVTFLQTLIDSIPIAVYYKDEKMRLIGCNKAFEDIMELPRNQIKNKTVDFIYFDEEAKIKSEETDLIVTKELTSISYEKLVKFKNSAPRNLLYYKSAYKKIDNTFGGIIGVIIDVTKERKMQQERDSLQENLIQQNKLASLGELAGSIAHELNNPLSVIVGYSQVLLRNKGFDEETRKALENIFEAAKRSYHTILNMLEFARADSSKMQSVRVNEIIQSTMLIVEKDLNNSKVNTFKKFSDDNKSIYANPMQIQQVILNIVLNAKDAMPEGGELHIETFIKGKNSIIKISDTGKGIEKGNVSRIFEPFFTTKEVGKGTGLGLSICYGIINAHKGRIVVSSEVDKGTSFEIILPTE